ncbi:MAG TPA: ABC transporter substrate-binding protein, partial [Iamia sp.]
VALETDMVVAAQYVVDALGAEALEPFGELTVVPDGITSEEVLGILADAFDRVEEADALLVRLTEAKQRARAEIPPQEVSVAAVYPGPSVAVFVDGPWAVPQTLLDAGCTLVPGADEPHDEDGRVYLSLENLDLIAGPTLLLLVAEAVEGEPAALEQIQDDPLWSELPAPAAGRVHELDRLGYPGVEGQIRLVDDLVEIFSG